MARIAVKIESKNGHIPNRPAFLYLSIILSSVVAGGKLAAWVKRKPENTNSSPAKATDEPNIAVTMSFSMKIRH